MPHTGVEALKTRMQHTTCFATKARGRHRSRRTSMYEAFFVYRSFAFSSVWATYSPHSWVTPVSSWSITVSGTYRISTLPHTYAQTQKRGRVEAGQIGTVEVIRRRPRFWTTDDAKIGAASFHRLWYTETTGSIHPYRTFLFFISILHNSSLTRATSCSA